MMILKHQMYYMILPKVGINSFLDRIQVRVWFILVLLPNSMIKINNIQLQNSFVVLTEMTLLLVLVIKLKKIRNLWIVKIKKFNLQMILEITLLVFLENFKVCKDKKPPYKIKIQIKIKTNKLKLKNKKLNNKNYLSNKNKLNCQNNKENKDQKILEMLNCQKNKNKLSYQKGKNKPSYQSNKNKLKFWLSKDNNNLNQQKKQKFYKKINKNKLKMQE